MSTNEHRVQCRLTRHPKGFSHISGGLLDLTLSPPDEHDLSFGLESKAAEERRSVLKLSGLHRSEGRWGGGSGLLLAEHLKAVLLDVFFQGPF